MRSFNQFLGNKIIERRMEECANLMVHGGIDPDRFASRYFEMVDENLLEGFWSDMMGKAKDAWGRWTSAGSKVAKSVVDGGLRQGWNQGRDIVAGPKVKFEKAMATLKSVAQFLHNNEKTTGMPSRINPQETIAKHLEKMIDILGKEVMPVLGDPKVTQDYERAGGDAPATQNTGASGQTSGTGDAPAAQSTGALGQASGTGGGVANSTMRARKGAQRAAQNMAARQPFTASPGNTPREDDENQRNMRYRMMTRQENRRP